MVDDYQTQLAQWKLNHGLNTKDEQNPEEIRMIAEDQKSKHTSWCLGCDKEMPIREMKLITRQVDPYVQYDEGETDYISPSFRVRMCPECFKEHYDTDTTPQNKDVK